MGRRSGSDGGCAARRCWLFPVACRNDDDQQDNDAGGDNHRFVRLSLSRPASLARWRRTDLASTAVGEREQGHARLLQ